MIEQLRTFDFPINSPKMPKKLSDHIKEVPLGLSVDCVVFGYDDIDKDLKILLIKSETPEFEGSWSLLGDLIQANESLKESAARTLAKRTGLSDIYLEQVRAFGIPERHPGGRVITIAYYSLIKVEDYELNIDKLDLEAKWFSINKIGKLAFDHNLILNHCLNKLKRTLREQPIGFSMLPDKFTLKQLQNLYEAVLDVEFDRRNFRRKLKKIDVLLELPETQQDVAHRPAKLYSFDKKKYQSLLKSGKHFSL